MNNQARPRGVEYEFTPEQNQILRTLYKRVTLVAVLVFLTTLITFAMFLKYGGILTLVGSIIGAVIAVTFYLPTDNFRRIITTQGRDIAELMRAFTELDKGWLIVNLVTAGMVVLQVVHLIRAI